MPIFLTLSCLIFSEKARELPTSTILTAPLGQLWIQDCYPPENDFTLNHHDILRDCISQRKTKPKKADLFKGAAGKGEVSGELGKSESLQDRTTGISPASLVHMWTHWLCFSGDA